MSRFADRYSRQELFGPLGITGQKKIRNSRVLLIGCGALGTNIANLIVRGGVGFLRIVDPDIVEASNLQRQVMFDQENAANKTPKALAAKTRLAQINEDVQIEAIVDSFKVENGEELLTGVDLVMDGTDNFETRYLVNDFCIKQELPWVYGGTVGATCACMAFMPQGPCLACLFPEPPKPGTTATADTAGIINPAPAMTAAMQVAEGLKILVGDKPRDSLWQVELWDGRWSSIKVKKSTQCPVCSNGKYFYLKG